LQIRLPRAAETTRAIVRNRNVYRHGFEFVQPLHGIFEAVTGLSDHFKCGQQVSLQNRPTEGAQDLKSL
jgi:hypothetical protein